MAFRRECQRILEPGGYVALMWNDRLMAGSAFLEKYEQLLERFGTDYVSVNHRNIGEEGVRAFFAPSRTLLSRAIGGFARTFRRQFTYSFQEQLVPRRCRQHRAL